MLEVANAYKEKGEATKYAATARKAIDSFTLGQRLSQAASLSK